MNSRSTYFNPLPSYEGRHLYRRYRAKRTYFNPLPSYEGRLAALTRPRNWTDFNPLPSYEGRLWRWSLRCRCWRFQSTPLMRGETGRVPRLSRHRGISIHSPHARGDGKTSEAHPRRVISIHSPHVRGDRISLQKSVRIYVSLHNKTMIHRFSGLYKPLFAAQSPIFGVRSPWKSHDSFTFAQPSAGRGITP